jgi:glyoxylase-like metal-dependent hydrolase (beta-lactamase superfamily II)
MKGCMWPIKTENKAERILWGPPQNQISWAYMKELREKDKTQKIYPCDPYCETYQFGDNFYGIFSNNCDGMGDVWMYVIIGPEKALLIDTAFGLGDTKALVNEITGGKPLIVANTHAGPDHCLGNVRFEKVYCHEYAVWGIQNKCKPHAWDYLFDQDGNNIWLDFDREDLPEYHEYKLVPVPNHYVFDLGSGYEVELIWMPGHDSGHAMFLDRTGRRLIAGDDVCSDVISCGTGGKPDDPYSKYCTLEAYRNELAKLCMRIDEFDYIFPGHFIVNLENSLMMDILNTLNEILEDPDSYDYISEDVSGNGGEKSIRKFKHIRGFSAIAYNDKGIYIPE